MTRAMHIETISAPGFAARGIGSCVGRGLAGFPNSQPKTLGADATT
jgi:hypothetical protein